MSRNNVTTTARDDNRMQPIHQVNSRAVDTHLHIADIVPKPEIYHRWEHLRPAWLIECVGEFFGVFFYVFAGVGATAAFNIGNLTQTEGLGSLLQIGAAYGLGIVFAITICGMASGGHFNPAVTIAFALFKDFPARKVPQYIIAQIFGAFVATFIIYGQYHPQITAIEAALHAGGKEAIIFSAEGTAGIFAIYPGAGIPLKWVFMNEFFVDFFLGLIIWGAIDPSNIFVTPRTLPFVVGFAYSVAIWGYVPATIATNAARDLGTRIAVTAIWGTDGWGGTYAALSALTSIPATIFAAFIYEMFLGDTSRVVTKSMRELIANTDRHREHQAYKYRLRENRRRGSVSTNNGSPDYKATREEIESKV